MERTEFQIENDNLMKNYLDRVFFDSWKQPLRRRKNEAYSRLEFIITRDCSFDCEYCYMKKNNENMYPKETYKNKEETIDNIRCVIEWLNKNGMAPEAIELFAGEMFNTFGYSVLDCFIEMMNKGYKSARKLIVPTGGSFAKSDKDVEKVKATMNRINEAGGTMYLSLSTDGAIIDDEVRPFKSKYKRDEKFYDRLFSLAKEEHMGFHPMIYSGAIDRWIENFNWFQKMFEKYNIDWYRLYLLEVRNHNWTKKQCEDLYVFVKYLVHWLWNKSEKNEENFLNMMRSKKWFNIITSPIISIGRGIGCGIQGTLYIRTGDLALVPCHRLQYKQFQFGRLIKENGSIVDLESNNVEALIGINTTHQKSYPMCEGCSINKMCNGSCLGAAYESTGDLFTACPTVCRMEYHKIKGILDGFEEIGVGNIIRSTVEESRKNQMEMLIKETI